MNANPPTQTLDPLISEQEIRRQAYALWQLRGCPRDQDLENWLMAKEHLRRKASIPSHGLSETATPFPNRHCLAAELTDSEEAVAQEDSGECF